MYTPLGINVERDYGEEFWELSLLPILMTTA